DMENDGVSLNDNRTTVEANDIPYIIKRFHHLENEADNKRTDKSVLVPFDEIKGNDYDLSINKYKEIEYEEIEYENPNTILDKVLSLESQINNDLLILK